MANTITIELCEEDRERIDRLTAVTAELISKGLACYVDPTKTPGKSMPVENEHPVENPFPEMDEPAKLEELPEETPVPYEQPKVERADIQRKVVELSGAGKKAQVRDIVKAYADKVSGIPEDKLAEVWAKLTRLEG